MCALFHRHQGNLLCHNQIPMIQYQLADIVHWHYRSVDRQSHPGKNLFQHQSIRYHQHLGDHHTFHRVEFQQSLALNSRNNFFNSDSENSPVNFRSGRMCFTIIIWQSIDSDWKFTLTLVQWRHNNWVGKLPELMVAGEFPFSSVVPQPAIQHAFPPVSASCGKQAALTQPSPHALHLWPASNWAILWIWIANKYISVGRTNSWSEQIQIQAWSTHAVELPPSFAWPAYHRFQLSFLPSKKYLFEVKLNRKRACVDWFRSFDQTDIKIWTVPWLIWFMNSPWFDFKIVFTQPSRISIKIEWHFCCELCSCILLRKKKSILLQTFWNTCSLEYRMFAESHCNFVHWCDDPLSGIKLWSTAMSGCYYPTVT